MAAGPQEAAAGEAGRAASARGALASLALAMLLASLGTSIANVALPSLARAFDASFQDVQWVVLAYLLAITSWSSASGGWATRAAAGGCCWRGSPCSRRRRPVRPRAHALAADRRAGGAGPRRRRHDGPGHGVRRRDGAQGKDRQRHGAARHDVGDRHGPRPAARRCVDRRLRLARRLPDQPAPGPAGLPARSSLVAGRSPGPGRTTRFRWRGHAAAGRDARGLCARHDHGARQLRTARPCLCS